VDYSFNGNNRNTTSGFAYDAAGDLTSDGTCTPCWTYGDSNELLSGNGSSYTYDGLGNRVQTIYGGYTHDFTLGQGGTPDVEYSGSSYVGSSGQGFFTYRNNTTYFHKTDHLSTPRVSTDYTGTEQRTETNLPFGDGFTETASPFVDYTGFAGGVWDINNASNADHFGAREYAKTQGRWLTPDPAGLAAVNPMDPQTWNRYAYVTNNPTTYNDPSGLVTPIHGPNPGPGMYVGGYNFGCETQSECDFFNPFSYYAAYYLSQFSQAAGSNVMMNGVGGFLCGEAEIPDNIPCGFPAGSSIGDILGIKPPSVCEFGPCGPSIGSPFHTDDNGTVIGDFPGEVLCSPGRPCTAWNPDLQEWGAYCSEGLSSCLDACLSQYVGCQLGEGWSGVSCLAFGPSPLRHGGESCGPTSFGPDVCLHNQGWCQLGCQSQCVGPYPPTIVPPTLPPPHRPGTWF